jgi:hypothetical protein
MRSARWSSLIAILMAGVSFSTAAQQKSGSATGWVQTKKTDPGRENSYVQFTLTGKFITRPKDSAGPPTIAVTCHPKGSRGRFIGASLNPGTLLTIQYVEPPEIKDGMSYNPKVNVRYRLDDGKEEKVQWVPSSDKTAITLAKDDLKKVLRAHTAQFTAAESHGGEVSMQFDIADPTQLETVCDLPAQKK